MSALPRILGVVADTHGLVRPELERALAGCEHILHAGDIGGADVLAALARIAPVTAVRGNNDRDAWAEGIAEEERVEFGGVRVRMLHDLGDFTDAPDAAREQIVVTGHSHRPCIEERDGVLFLNPGSAGPRRFKLPITCAVVHVEAEGAPFRAELIDLEALS